MSEEKKEELKLKKRDVLMLHQNLPKLGNLKGVKLSFAIAKNKKIVEEEAEALVEAVAMTDEYKKYEEERLKLCKKYASKDDSGNPVLVADDYLIKDQVAFDEAIKELNDANTELIEERDKQVEEGNKLLDEYSSIKLHKIKYEYIPDDVTIAQMDILLPLIAEDLNV